MSEFSFSNKINIFIFFLISEFIIYFEKHKFVNAFYSVKFLQNKMST